MEIEEIVNNKNKRPLSNSEQSFPKPKKFRYDGSVVSNILINVDPAFIEEIWVASSESMEEFNERIMNAFEENNYRKTVQVSQPLPFLTHQPQNIEEAAQILPHSDFQNAIRTTNNMPAASGDIGLMLTCECCYDDLPFVDALECSKELHNFCRGCVKKCCEMTLSNGETLPKCMTECTGTFSVAVLEAVLPGQLLQNLQRKQQAAEIAEAALDGLESCPFCDYAYIPLPTDTVFSCLNEHCLKHSCRLCKEISHLPLRCDQVERPNDLAARQRIEEAMTEALICKCHKCGKTIVKESGCNKLTCVCGAFMCYVCKQPISGYDHFNQGSGNLLRLSVGGKKCPLSGCGIGVRHVREAGKKARAEELAKNPELHIIIDPTAAVPKNRKKAKRRPFRNS